MNFTFFNSFIGVIALTLQIKLIKALTFFTGFGTKQDIEYKILVIGFLEPSHQYLPLN